MTFGSELVRVLRLEILAHGEVDKIYISSPYENTICQREVVCTWREKKHDDEHYTAYGIGYTVIISEIPTAIGQSILRRHFCRFCEEEILFQITLTSIGGSLPPTSRKIRED